MLIKTSQPIILDRDKITLQIAKFWDQISEGWRVIWGKHIHHGFYENDQTISHDVAQHNLIIKLTELLTIPNGATILDVGCGMGGSSIFLAEKYQANVTGITLSQKQASIARAQAAKLNNVIFKVEDALALPSIPDNSIDIVWSLESCEQFFDKELFIQQAYRVLKPGGKLMLATWCSDREEYHDSDAKSYQKLCLAFDVPYMPTIEWYRETIIKNNFQVNTILDWSHHVKKSWDIGVSLVNAYSFLKLLKLGGLRGLRFAKQIKLMRDAFIQEKVKYGVFVASKITDSHL